jgi:predicted transcriptional regulator
MPEPVGTLTAAQHEILEVIWNSQKIGATVTEIWQAISERREVTRTTVLNQVDRLEKRGWLRRKKHQNGFRYVVTRGRDQAARSLAEEFVDSFFGGSASNLVMSLLGSKKLKPSDIAKLRELLDSQSSKRKPTQ